MAPRVFLSSTVKDLADLRSAVRYLLEQYGFEVFASENPDFPHDLDTETRVAALGPIDDADYYVLIVGSRRGALTSDGVSVTRSEFRRARAVHRETGRPRLVLLARQDILDAAKRGPTYVLEASEDWTAVRAFLDEIGTAADPRDPNWVHGFRSFGDLATALRTALRLSGPLRRLALEANLVEELGGNLQLLLAKLRDLVVPAQDLLMPHLVPAPSDRAVFLDRQATASIWVYRFSLPAPNALASVALSDAISSGDFLGFDPASGAMTMSEVQQAMLHLRQRIARYETLLSLLSTGPSAVELAGLRGDRREDLVPVSSDLRVLLYAIRDELANVSGLATALQRFFSGIDTTIAPPPMNPPTPLEEDARRIEASSVTRDEALRWALRQTGRSPARVDGETAGGSAPDIVTSAGS